jgi:hypothetical protein
VTNQNRFYALRDFSPFASMDRLQYRAFAPIVEADLVDVTTDVTADVPQSSRGWKLDLVAGGGWIGEKVLSEARTFNNQVFVTTFEPGGVTTCEPALGTNRQYVMSIFNGAPTTNRDGSVDTDPLSEEDRYEEWVGAPPPETVFIFADDPNCVGATCPPVACVDINCGLTNFPNNPTRTFWSQESIE